MKYLFSNEKEQATETCNRMYESSLQYVKSEKARFKKLHLRDCSQMTFLKRKKEKLYEENI